LAELIPRAASRDAAPLHDEGLTAAADQTVTEYDRSEHEVLMNSTTVAVLASALLCRCSTVTTPYAVGERDLQINAEEWEGLWLGADGGVVVLKVIDSATGSLDAFWLDEESGTPVLRRSAARLRESHGWIFGSVPDEVDDDGTEPPEFVWARVVNDRETLTLWSPDVEKFKRLVEEGRLPGTASSSVELGTLEPSHYELITSDAEGVLFDWEEPIVLRRVAR
jgi:hypothetical protein